MGKKTTKKTVVKNEQSSTNKQVSGRKTKAEKRALRLEQRSDQIQTQRSNARNRRRNKKILNYSIVGLIVIVTAIFFLNKFSTTNTSGDFDSLAQCLTEKGAGMFGTDWCPHCQEQKRLFGNSFKLVTYINCDANSQACTNEGVTGYPTWIFADNSRLTGTQDLSVLAEKAGCSLIE